MSSFTSQRILVAQCAKQASHKEQPVGGEERKMIKGGRKVRLFTTIAKVMEPSVKSLKEPGGEHENKGEMQP